MLFSKTGRLSVAAEQHNEDTCWLQGVVQPSIPGVAISHVRVYARLNQIQQIRACSRTKRRNLPLFSSSSAGRASRTQQSLPVLEEN